MRNNTVFLLYLFLLFSFILCDPKAEKKTEDKESDKNKKKPVEINILGKAQLCMGLSHVFDGQEKLTLEELTTRVMELNEEFGEQEAKDFITSFILVNCIENLKPEEFETLNEHVKQLKEFDYKEYATPLKFDEIKNMLINNDTKLLDIYNKRVIKFNNEYQKAYSQFQESRGGDAFRGSGDIGVFGSKFKDMSKTKKNLIGFGLMLVVGLLLGFLAMKIMNLGKKEKKKKDKKKTN